jgi:hypothetical protein
MKVAHSRLKEIAARVQAASPGPWEADAISPDAEGKFIQGPTPVGYEREYLPADADFMAHAREDVPDLVADLSEARAELERLEWVDPESEGTRYCLRCLQNEHFGHATDCQLARVLGRTPKGATP